MRRSIFKYVSFALAAGLGAAAMSAVVSAGEKEKSEKAENAPDPRIGEQVRSICFHDSISGWKSVKGEDNVVLLERNVRDWYRVELSGGCDESLFRHAYKIGIDSRPGGSCVTPGDVIIVEDSPGFPRRCFINKIYKWDDKALDDAPEDDAGDDAGDDADNSDS